jgi:hypothetical protein
MVVVIVIEGIIGLCQTVFSRCLINIKISWYYTSTLVLQVYNQCLAFSLIKSVTGQATSLNLFLMHVRGSDDPFQGCGQKGY